MKSEKLDVVIVGKGNAALCAALAARDAGASVAMLEVAPEEEAGGNSRYAGGVMRFAYASVEDLKRVSDLTDTEVAGTTATGYAVDFGARPLGSTF